MSFSFSFDNTICMGFIRHLLLYPHPTTRTYSLTLKEKIQEFYFSNFHKNLGVIFPYNIFCRCKQTLILISLYLLQNLRNALSNLR